MSNISLKSYIYKQLNDDLKSTYECCYGDSFSVVFQCARDDDIILPIVQEWYATIVKKFERSPYTIDEPVYDDDCHESPCYAIWFHYDKQPTLPESVFPTADND
jgi:hypothetical protein